jgi:hypothetical protein
MPHGPESQQELAEIAAQLAAAERSELPLFGLTASFTGPRTLNGVGWHGDVVNQVALSHGLWTDTRIDVTVIGPLHGHVAGGAWSIDPLPAIAGELLNHAGETFGTSAEFEQRIQALLRQEFDDVEILVDGRPKSFRLLRNGNHWAALHDIEPSRLLCVVASNTAPTDVELERLDNLAAYAQSRAQ